ncbi:hypothetical protein PsB1_0844 [Candidatus Phycosocius spiralis]|uniref:Uncharacterized protein n=1 Tax=Candidatus Phycosocius spiralis TaxID=2815099 RepID=A0ABQ4PUI4_9PROT|nr:hypothetical protein PsB1_0844 [Candidatus Phycosocius spiralis]
MTVFDLFKTKPLNIHGPPLTHVLNSGLEACSTGIMPTEWALKCQINLTLPIWAEAVPKLLYGMITDAQSQRQSCPTSLDL